MLLLKIKFDLMDFDFCSSKVLEGLGYSVPENELSTFINQIDTDKSGA